MRGRRCYGYDFAKPLAQLHMSKRMSNGANTKAPKIGRNDRCPCGSGLKFKKCCLLRTEPPQPRMMASKDGLSWGEVPSELREKAATSPTRCLFLFPKPSRIETTAKVRCIGIGASLPCWWRFC